MQGRHLRTRAGHAFQPQTLPPLKRTRVPARAPPAAGPPPNLQGPRQSTGAPASPGCASPHPRAAAAAPRKHHGRAPPGAVVAGTPQGPGTRARASRGQFGRAWSPPAACRAGRATRARACLTLGLRGPQGPPPSAAGSPPRCAPISVDHIVCDFSLRSFGGFNLLLGRVLRTVSAAHAACPCVELTLIVDCTWR